MLRSRPSSDSRPGEAEPVEQPEGERQHPLLVDEDRSDVVERGRCDREGDDRLDQAGGELDDSQAAESEGDRVGDREHGHDLEHPPQRRAEARRRVPALLLVTPLDEDEHRREHEGEDEQDVVGPDPDVLGSQFDDAGHALEPGGVVELHQVGGVALAEPEELVGLVVERPGSPIGGDQQEPVTIAVGLDDGVVRDGEGPRRWVETLLDLEVEDGVRPAPEVEELDVLELVRPGREAVLGPDREVLGRVVLDDVGVLLQRLEGVRLADGDVQPEDAVEIVDRVLDATGNRRVEDLEIDVALVPGMGAGRRRPEERHEEEENDSQDDWTNTALQALEPPEDACLSARGKRDHPTPRRRATMFRWMSDVPEYTSPPIASRRSRSTSNSVTYPFAP